MLKAVKSAGFTLIELAIGLAIISILLVLGMPTLNTVLDNSRLRTAASTFNSGIQLARAQAISRNMPVDFIPMTVAGNLSTGWTVQESASNVLIESKPVQESSGQMIRVAEAGGTVVAIRFNGLGAATFRDSTGTPVTVSPARFSFSSNSGACFPSGSIRCLEIRVTSAGQVRLCDPTVTATSDNRLC